jgi:hypothetical protein
MEAVELPTHLPIHKIQTRLNPIKCHWAVYYLVLVWWRKTWILE